MKTYAIPFKKVSDKAKQTKSFIVTNNDLEEVKKPVKKPVKKRATRKKKEVKENE